MTQISSNFKKQHLNKENVVVVNQKLGSGSTVFNNKYRLTQLIGKGAFGEVYKGVLTEQYKRNNLKDSRVTAIKVQNDSSNYSQIANEVQVLNSIQQQSPDSFGFPEIYASGIQSGHPFMIMDILGPNLYDLMSLCGGKFSLKTALLLTTQIIQRIEILHEIGYVYRDIKPENFCLGIGKHSKQVFMIDFGLCKRYRDKNTKLFLPYREGISMTGTIRYSSINSHLGIDQTRRDDLQSICYLLIYFLKGQLPWQGISFEHKFEKDHMIMESKLKIKPQDLYSGLPEEIISIYQYIRSLDFYDDPDYRYIIGELSCILESIEDSKNFQYDWQILPEEAKLNRTHLEINIPKMQEQIKPQPQKVDLHKKTSYLVRQTNPREHKKRSGFSELI